MNYFVNDIYIYIGLLNNDLQCFLRINLPWVSNRGNIHGFQIKYGNNHYSEIMWYSHGFFNHNMLVRWIIIMSFGNKYYECCDVR